MATRPPSRPPLPSTSSNTPATPATPILPHSSSTIPTITTTTFLSYDALESSLVHQLNTIQRNVDLIQSRIKLLRTLHDTQALQKKLDQIQLENTFLLQQSANDIKQLTQLAESSGIPQNKLAARRIVSDLSNLATRFQAVQQNLLQHYKQHQQQQKLKQHGEEYDDAAREDTPLLPSSSSKMLLLAEPELQEIKYNDTLITERAQEIQQIEQGVFLVNDVFKKIGNLVQDQGQLFDHIETNLQYTQVHLESADQELTRANKRGEKWKRFKCWLLVCLVVVFFMLVLIHLVLS